METKVLILDEMIEQGLRDYQRIPLALGRVLEVRPAGPRSHAPATVPGSHASSVRGSLVEVRNYLTATEILDSPPSPPAGREQLRTRTRLYPHRPRRSIMDRQLRSVESYAAGPLPVILKRREEPPDRNPQPKRRRDPSEGGRLHADRTSLA